MLELSSLLEPPTTCRASSMAMKDKRKASVWVCLHSRKVIGKSKKHPGCKCAEILRATKGGRE